MPVEQFQRPKQISPGIFGSPPTTLATILILGLTSIFPAEASSAATQNGANQAVLERVISEINLGPDHACTFPETAIETWLASNVNAEGLMDNVARTVFHRDPGRAPAASGLDAQMQRVRDETARLKAQNDAVYRARETGGQVPVGESAPPEAPRYESALQNIKAVRRIDNGLDCSAEARVGFVRFGITYTLVLNANDKDGWTSNLQIPPLNEAAALSATPAIAVRYGGDYLTLGQARQQSQSDAAAKDAADVKSRQQNAAQAAYENSAAGRLAAIQQRQAMAVKQRACEAHGGTWGVPFGTTIVQVDARTASGLVAMEQACYFLGRK